MVGEKNDRIKKIRHWIKNQIRVCFCAWMFKKKTTTYLTLDFHAWLQKHHAVWSAQILLQPLANPITHCILGIALQWLDETTVYK